MMAAMVAMRPLLPIDETRYLSVAWEMWMSGDPVHLTKNFDSYTHKTPLLFVMINLVWLVTGVSEAQFELLKWFFVEVNDDSAVRIIYNTILASLA